MRFNVTLKDDERVLTNITREDELRIWSDVLRDAGLKYTVRIVINSETETESSVVSIKDTVTREEFNELVGEARRRAIKLNDDQVET